MVLVIVRCCSELLDEEEAAICQRLKVFLNTGTIYSSSLFFTRSHYFLPMERHCDFGLLYFLLVQSVPVNILAW